MRKSRRLLTVLIAGAVAILLAACGDDDDSAVTKTEPTSPEVTTTTAAGSGGVELHLTSTLSGAEEVPRPGVADGTGTADVKVGEVELCYKLTATMGEKPTGAHIHEAGKGKAGEVVADLAPVFTPAESAFTAENCVKPDRAAMVKISYNPDLFYVNIHTAEHPAGAIRGQLAQAAS